MFISLGGNCSIAYQINKHNVNYTKSPFDWCKTSLKQMIKVFENNFEDYNNLSYVKISLNHLSIDNKPSCILKNIYGIQFAHEIVDKYEIDDYKNILLERIRKFISLKEKEIIFIRIELENNNNNFTELLLLLDKYFDNYKFILISKINPKINKIIHYELPEFIDWKFDNINWNQIFNLRLIL